MIMIIETISFTIPFPGNIPTFAAPPPQGAESNHIGRGRGGKQHTFTCSIRKIYCFLTCQKNKFYLIQTKFKFSGSFRMQQTSRRFYFFPEIDHQNNGWGTHIIVYGSVIQLITQKLSATIPFYLYRIVQQFFSNKACIHRNFSH